MQKLRVIVLGALALAAVAVFLVGPTEGRFAREATMILIGVLALIWHLALTPSGQRRASTEAPAAVVPTAEDASVEAVAPLVVPVAAVAEAVPGPDEAEPEPDVIDLTAGDGALAPSPSRAGYFELEPAASGPRSRRTEVIDVPAAAAQWPPPKVEVPSVFSAPTQEPVERAPVTPKVPDAPVPKAPAVDAPAVDAPTQNTPTESTPTENAPTAVAAPVGANKDPWLVWVGDMFSGGSGSD